MPTFKMKYSTLLVMYSWFTVYLLNGKYSITCSNSQCTLLLRPSVISTASVIYIIYIYIQGRRTWGGRGAIAPPCFKVEGQCPPTFPYLTLLLSTNIIHLHLLQVIQLLEVGLLQSMYYHHYKLAIICTNLLESVTLV